MLVPLGWLVLALRHVAPRKGLALVLTPAELMLRTRAGVLAIPWPDLVKVSVAERPSFSVLLGLHTARALVLTRRDAPSVRYDEEYLGLPAYVVAAIADAHRRGLMLPRS